MHDKQVAAPDNTAVRVAFWRALHVEVDALRPLKAEVWSQPVTPEKLLRALGHI
jgi:hypothetical protein